MSHTTHEDIDMATQETEDELRDVIDVLRQPLQGRSVLVPLGGQAFLEGTLDPMGSYEGASNPPAVSSSSVAQEASGGAVDGVGGDSGSNEEHVMIKIHNQDAEGERLERILTRQQAKEYFEGERDALLSAKGRSQGKVAEKREAPMAVDDKKAPISSSKRTTKLQSTTKKVSAPSTTTKPSAPSIASSSAAVPEPDAPAFFEIREELDEQGREVRAEAVDVSRQLALLESDAAHHDSTLADEWKRQPFSRSGGGNIAPTSDVNSSSDAMHPSADKSSKSIMSDAEYERLTARLDELAMLEEQAENNKVVNKASRKGLQGGGWSTGFLNSGSKKKKQQQVPQPKPPDRMVESSNVPSMPDSQPSRLEAEEEPRSRVVSFDPQGNDVREIPRVGQRSARELKKPASSATTINNPGYDDGGTGGSVASVVRERIKPSSKKKQAAASTPMPPPPAQSSPSDQPPRRLSRFAQERLRQQQEQDQR